MLFIHLSDIHFKKTQAGQPDDPNRALRNDLIHDIKEMRKKIGCPADGILLSGDIAFAGKPEEYEFAFKWLELELCPAAGCELTDVFVVPGNHDIDRNAAVAPAQKNAREYLRSVPLKELEAHVSAYMRDQISSEVIFGPLENYNRFAAKFLCSLGPYVAAPGKEPMKPFAVRNLNLNDRSILRIWGFNSVLVSDINDTDKNMIVDPAAAQIEREDGVTHLVICHHPFNWLRNGAPFRDRIEGVAHVHLFGHEHTRRVEPHQDFVRIRAGAVQPDRDDAEWKPGYNWIDLQIEGEKENRFLVGHIWVRLHDTRPPQFLDVTDKWGKSPWQVRIPLEPWYPRNVSKPQQSTTAIDILDQAVDPEKPPNIDFRSVAIKISLLRVDQVEQLMKDLGLNEPTDRNLKDYELGIAALRRAVERKALDQLSSALEKMAEQS